MADSDWELSNFDERAAGCSIRRLDCFFNLPSLLCSSVFSSHTVAQSCRMFHQKTGSVLQSTITALLFCLFFTHCCRVSGAVPQPVTTLAGLDGKGGVELQCESAGWYPEPEVLWLDGDGNLLSAGPTETVRGPDDLYTVSSRVTVEKKHSNNFTCRVQQKKINQSRETEIHVPDDFFKVQSSNTSTIVGLAVSIIVLFLAVVLFVRTQRQKRKMKTLVNEKQEELELLQKKLEENEKKWTETERELRIEHTKLEEKSSETNNQLQQEKEEKKNAENEVKTLKNELEELQDEKLKWTETERKLKKFILNMMQELDGTNAQHWQLKEPKLKEQEEQRRKEAEITIQRLKEELDMKKTEVKNKQTELQSLQEEKKKIQDDLQNLIKDLNTKITELETIREELAKSSWMSHIPWSGAMQEKWKKKEDEKRMQTEIENLNKPLMTKNMEFQNKDKKCEEKQVKLKKLLDDQQKMETELQIEEQQLLEQEKEERMKAENEVKILKNELEELQKKLEENEKTWMETERELRIEHTKLEEKSSETNNQLQQEKEEKKKAENEVKTLKNELEELKRNHSETKNQLQQEKQKNEKAESDMKTLNSRLEELRGNNSETDNQLQQEKQKNETLNSRLEELMKTETELRTVIQNMNKELEEISQTNSADGKSMIAPITVEEVHQYGHYIRLKNIFTEALNLGGWELVLQINNGKPGICKFKESLKLQAGEILCISRQRWFRNHPDDVKLVWLDMKKWKLTDKLQMNLISNNGDIQITVM
ncbi:interaptin-like isoform X3 [Acanthochromis polyacanthus]|uniref:interaptin-like isoform X3 n=1 Tax=Acanthochromis polyacanthus TaxID=80966 RepID=UPI00223408DC|nr:interaptin-like isoform X3 [Acanthochromis polyacanthus]